MPHTHGGAFLGGPLVGGGPYRCQRISYAPLGRCYPSSRSVQAGDTTVVLGLEYEGREDLLQGYVEGLWSAPTAERYWRKVIVAQIVIAREEEVARAFGVNSPGG